MKKNFLLAVFAVVLVMFLINGTKIQSVDEYYMTHMEDIGPDDETVIVSIRCDTILDNWDDLDEQLKDEKYVPKDGVILPETKYVLRKDDTAYELLKRVCRYNQIQMDYLGPSDSSYSGGYVKSINNLYEHSCGRLSGWMFRINGTFPQTGAGAYKLKNHDRVEWVFTCDLGRDVGDPFEMKKR